MSELFPTNQMGYLGVLLVFFRMLGLFLLIPGFSHKAIPVGFKVLLALSVSLVLYPLVQSYLVLNQSVALLFVSVIRESAIGLLMGFVIFATFEAINLGAQFVGFQMGLGTAAMMDPESHAPVSSMVPFQAWLAILIFFLTDMHHQVIEAFTESFRITQSFDVGALQSKVLPGFFIGVTAKLFALAVQLGAPITLMVLCCNAVIGMLSRIMPQMNILLFSFPITITLGFAALYVVAPELLDSIEIALSESINEMTVLVRYL